MALSVVAATPRHSLPLAWTRTRRSRPRGPVATAAVMLPALVLLIVVAVLLACVALVLAVARRGPALLG